MVSIAENDKSSIIRPCRFCGTTAREDTLRWRHVGREFQSRNDTDQACFDLVVDAGMDKFNRLVGAIICGYFPRSSFLMETDYLSPVWANTRAGKKR
jgi:hypothetical protein